MAWNEDWLHEERPDASDLPEYSILPKNRYGWQLFAYFTAIPVVFYVAIATLGRKAILIGNIPILVVLTLLIAGAFILGLLHIRFREKAASEGERRTPTESDSQKPEEAA
ncbi:hypothetical protein [Halococcus sp. AFM35]|uniref:hypothetical protein n=1 Tax=Halococcus sp. AFM35 TaxID=3421653 RepID=UPI003EB7E56D